MFWECGELQSCEMISQDLPQKRGGHALKRFLKSQDLEEEIPRFSYKDSGYSGWEKAVSDYS